MTEHKGNYKRKLNRGIAQSCWGLLDQQLSYKTLVEKVDPAYTSQDCSSCGNRGVRRGDSFKCGCGFETGADYNASLNILSGWEYPSAEPTGYCWRRSVNCMHFESVAMYIIPIS